jgi:hypothetical protein
VGDSVVSELIVCISKLHVEAECRLFLVSRSQYLPLRDSFADQWQPRGGIGSTMIEMLAASYFTANVLGKRCARSSHSHVSIPQNTAIEN